MKHCIFTLVGVLCVMSAQSQPRPYEPDPYFVPALDFMQKSWSGEYDGLEPNSRMILSISRTLVLNEDFTYTNEVKGHIKDQSVVVLLRYERGTYQYNPENHSVNYSIEQDSTLDINILLRGENLSYTVNHYSESGTAKTSAEDVQFTRASSAGDRQWIVFDQQLMSPVDSRQKAVYVMTGARIDLSDIKVLAPQKNSTGTQIYDLYGREFQNIPIPGGIYIKNGKKVLLR